MPPAPAAPRFSDDPTVPHGASPWCPPPSSEPTEPRVRTLSSRSDGFTDAQLALIAAAAGASATAATAVAFLSLCVLLVTVLAPPRAAVERSLHEVIAVSAAQPEADDTPLVRPSPERPAPQAATRRKVVMIGGVPPVDPVPVDVRVDDPSAVLFIDGQEVGAGSLDLVLDGGPHEVRVVTRQASGAYRVVAEAGEAWCFSTEGRAVRPVTCGAR